MRRALSLEDPSLLPLFFEVAVLERYLSAPGFSIIRTDTVGRVKKEGGWALDFGIAPDESILHLTWRDLSMLPEAEREHWGQHAVSLPASKMFLQMRLAPGSCADDGELRKWAE